MATWLSQAAGALIGRTGRGISAAGQFYGNRLPEFKVSENLERIGGMLNPVRPANASYTPPSSQATNYNYSDAYSPVMSSQSGSVLGRNTTGGGGGGNTQVPSTSNNPNFDNINQQTGDFASQIDREYNDQMDMLAGQEAGLQGQAGLATSGIENEAGKVRTSLGEEQATKEGSAQLTQQTSEKQGASAMQQARDLFRQTQQSNIANLSGLGISSSSVAEALAETLGVETARRIAGITGSLNEVRLNTVKELGRIKDYFAQKKTQLDQDVAIRKQEIQQSLLAGIQQINSARTQAATAKARQRLELFSNAQNVIANLQEQYNKFNQELTLWREQKASALEPIAQDPNYVQNLITQANTLNQQFAPSQFGFAPSFNVNAKGEYTGQINPYKKKEDEYTGLTNPYAT